MKSISLFVVFAVFCLVPGEGRAGPLVVIEPSTKIVQYEKAATPEESARRFLMDSAGELGLSSDLSDLVLESVTQSPAGFVVRFQQKLNGLLVDRASLAVSLSKELRPLTYVNSVVPVSQTMMLLNENGSARFKISKNEAIAKAYSHLKLTASPVKQEVVSRIKFHQGSFRTVYQIRISAPLDRRYAWELLMDANTGKIYRSMNLILNHREKNAAIRTNVFDPNPTIRSGKAMDSVTGFSDNNNADSPFFQSMLTQVSLEDLTEQNGKFILAGPNVVIVDSDSPRNPECSFRGDLLTLKRSDPCFDAVNVYYFIDKSMKYLNGKLGFDLHPLRYQGGIRVDPHGVNGDDNSYYSSFSDQLAFGQGGVDDAQDHDVIIHELGHALHNWITNGHLSQAEGLSEGSGDYWAASYGRQFMKPGHVAYQWTFSFDGHNSFWPGRSVGVTSKYPAGATGGIHSAGQLWATTCMEIYDEIGKERADKLFWTALSALDEGSNQADAARSYVVATQQLYPELTETVLRKFRNRGYPVR
ncbi:MAG: hypothetical protein KGP28_06070 [Bdellovibrionales bacterium]|nr:hypothetical protein [Bdellovibrionales bacterium]